jgi:hypothetical protein
MTDRERIKFQSVRARAELRVLEMYMIGSWNEYILTLEPGELQEDPPEPQGTISIDREVPRTEQQSHSAGVQPLI